MRIFELHLNNLRNEEHLNLQNNLKELVLAATPVALGIEKLWPAWLALHENEKEAIEFISKSARTAALAEADQRRDEVLIGFRAHIKAAALHFNSDRKAAAMRLRVVFDQYDGIEKRAYNEETTSIENLLADLNQSHLADIALLGLNEFMAELHACNQAFSTLLAERYTETANRTPLRMKAIRQDMDAIYDQICTRINARMLLDGNEVIEGFIKELNSRHEALRIQIAQRKGRHTASDAIPEAPEA